MMVCTSQQDYYYCEAITPTRETENAIAPFKRALLANLSFSLPLSLILLCVVLDGAISDQGTLTTFEDKGRQEGITRFDSCR